MLRSAGFRTLVRSSRTLGVVAGSVLVLAGLAACDSGSSGSSLIRTAIKVQSITQSGSCEDVNVKVMPGELLPNPPSNANKGEFVTTVKLTKAADGVACSGDTNTIPMAPGKWTFKAILPSNIQTCEKDVPAAGGVSVSFKDGDAACN